MPARAPKYYKTIEEFQREEIRSGEKLGFSLDDLFNEATYHAEQEFQLDDPAELDFEE